MLSRAYLFKQPLFENVSLYYPYPLWPDMYLGRGRPRKDENETFLGMMIGIISLTPVAVLFFWGLGFEKILKTQGIFKK